MICFLLQWNCQALCHSFVLIKHWMPSIYKTLFSNPLLLFSPSLLFSLQLIANCSLTLWPNMIFETLEWLAYMNPTRVTFSNFLTLGRLAPHKSTLDDFLYCSQLWMPYLHGSISYDFHYCFHPWMTYSLGLSMGWLGVDREALGTTNTSRFSLLELMNTFIDFCM